MSDIHRDSPEGDSRSVEGSTLGQIIMLLAQLPIGMAVNLLGLPQETSGTARIETAIVFGAHLLVAFGLLAGAIVLVVRAHRGTGGHTAAAVRGLGATVAAFAAGVLDFLTGSDWWSFLMAASATAAIVFYGVLYVRLLRSGSPRRP